MTAIEKHLEQKKCVELIMTACVMTACMCSVWVFVNTEAPWLGAIQTACYIKFYAEPTLFGIGEVPIFKNAG
jgi:hypothetical protein